MMLRRYHDRPDPDTEPDRADDAPQAEKPAGRSRSRKSKEG